MHTRRLYLFYYERVIKGQQAGGLLETEKGQRIIGQIDEKGIQKPLGVATYQLQEVVERTITEIENRKK